MNNEQAEAIKRVILKRYLVLSQVDLDFIDWPTNLLQALVIGLHRQVVQKGRPQYAWPLSKNQIIQISKQNHYLKNLVALKRAFGLDTKMGCVTGSGCDTTDCGTVAELIEIGWVPARYAYLDAHLHKLGTP